MKHLWLKPNCGRVWGISGSGFATSADFVCVVMFGRVEDPIAERQNVFKDKQNVFISKRKKGICITR